MNNPKSDGFQRQNIPVYKPLNESQQSKSSYTKYTISKITDHPHIDLKNYYRILHIYHLIP